MARCRQCGSELDTTARFCPSCGGAAGGEKAEAAPAVSPVRRAGMVLIPLALLAGGVVFWRYLHPSAHPVIAEQPRVAESAVATDTVGMTDIAVREEGDDLVFPLAAVREHRLVRFEYKGGKTPRSVLAYVEPAGRLVTAISLSEHCGSTEFTIGGGQIRCAQCPSRWDMATMEAYACCAKYYPDPIPSRVTGDEVRIRKSAVREWAGRL